MRDLSLRMIATLAMGAALMMGCGGTITEVDTPESGRSSTETEVHAMAGNCDPTCGPYTFCCHTTSDSPYYCYQSWYSPCGEGGACGDGRHCVTNAGVSQCFGDEWHCD